jgi:hypothetical protein
MRQASPAGSRLADSDRDQGSVLRSVRASIARIALPSRRMRPSKICAESDGQGCCEVLSIDPGQRPPRAFVVSRHMMRFLLPAALAGALLTGSQQYEPGCGRAAGDHA